MNSNAKKPITQRKIEKKSERLFETQRVSEKQEPIVGHRYRRQELTPNNEGEKEDEHS